MAVDHFTYLGIVIHKDIRQFDALNLSPTIQNLTSKLKAWENLPLTLVGRINIFKMFFFLNSFTCIEPLLRPFPGRILLVLIGSLFMGQSSPEIKQRYP